MHNCRAGSEASGSMETLYVCILILRTEVPILLPVGVVVQ